MREFVIQFGGYGYLAASIVGVLTFIGLAVVFDRDGKRNGYGAAGAAGAGGAAMMLGAGVTVLCLLAWFIAQQVLSPAASSRGMAKDFQQWKSQMSQEHAVRDEDWSIVTKDGATWAVNAKTGEAKLLTKPAPAASH